MTGQQPNPASGTNIKGEPAQMLNFEELCKAIGVKNVVTFNPHKINEARKILKDEIDRPEPSVVISQAPCVLLPSEKKRVKVPLEIKRDYCTGCMACLGLGCPAIHWIPVTPEEGAKLGFKEKQKGYSEISLELCNGCGQCAELCKFEAISVKEDK
jgi:indolepyruvate ferredoxin oxidoreductase alpha subunit